MSSGLWFDFTGLHSLFKYYYKDDHILVIYIFLLLLMFLFICSVFFLSHWVHTPRTVGVGGASGLSRVLVLCVLVLCPLPDPPHHPITTTFRTNTKTETTTETVGNLPQ